MEIETQDYRVGDYLMMGAAGKIDFLCSVHRGSFHGWHFPVQWLLAEESFPALKEAVREQAPEVQKPVSEILDGIDTDQVKREELKIVMMCD